MDIAEYVGLPRQKVISAGKATIALPLSQPRQKEIALALAGVFRSTTLSSYIRYLKKAEYYLRCGLSLR